MLDDIGQAWLTRWYEDGESRCLAHPVRPGEVAGRCAHADRVDGIATSRSLARPLFARRHRRHPGRRAGGPRRGRAHRRAELAPPSLRRPGAKRWPRATVHGAPGLVAKRPDVKFHRELGRDVEPAWRDAIEVELVGGAPRLNEAVLFHRPSGSLPARTSSSTSPSRRTSRRDLLLAMTGAGGRGSGRAGSGASP